MADDERKFAVTVGPHGWRFDAADNQPLLRSAEAAGVKLPSSCRNGTCRACICRMTAGRVHYRIEWPGLSADEKREGYILPCVAYPDADITLESRGARRD
jgi:ferredoxin